MLGTGAIGRFAFTQFPQDDVVPVASELSWTSPVRRAGLSAAVIATTVAGFVPPQVQAAQAFSAFSQSSPAKFRAAIISTTSAGFIAPQVQTAPVFSSFSSPQPTRQVLPDEQPGAWLYEFTPLAVPFSGFMDFGAPRAARYSFADQQTSMLFEVVFVPPLQGGGTSRRLPDEQVSAPERGRKTGLEPVKKLPPQKVETVERAIPLPPFKEAPALPPSSAPDSFDPALVPSPSSLLELQEQIRAAHNEAQDEQDAADIADVLALLD